MLGFADRVRPPCRAIPGYSVGLRYPGANAAKAIKTSEWMPYAEIKGCVASARC